MSNLSPCVTCPYRLEFQERVDSPEKMEPFVASFVEQPTEELLDQFRADGQAVHDGMEAARPECPGYKRQRLIADMLINKWLGYSCASAMEAHCNNPFLETEKYSQLDEGLMVSNLRDRNDKQRQQHGLPSIDKKPTRFRLMDVSLSAKVMVGVMGVAGVLGVTGALSAKPKSEATPATPHGLTYVASELEHMHLGWGKDKDRAQGGITGYRALPNGEQVETIVFGDGAKSVENKRVNPHKVMEIIVNVYARGVNHLNPATNTLDSYWFESDPDPQESPGIPSNITYGVGVSYASQLNDGVIGMEAFQNATVNTYTDPKDPATDPYEQLLHRYGDKTSANATALAIEDQALAIASDASHDKDMSKLREVQHPRQLDVTGGRGQVLVAQVERNGTRESVNS